MFAKVLYCRQNQILNVLYLSLDQRTIRFIIQSNLSSDTYDAKEGKILLVNFVVNQNKYTIIAKKISKQVFL